MRLVEQMRVNLLRGGRRGMAERLTDIVRRNARLIGQRRECVPLRYNNDKQKKPLFSKALIRMVVENQ